MDASAQRLIGQRIGSYRIVDFLGEGGMAHVFIGEHVDPNMARRAAIKVILPELCQHEQIVRRFINEARALGRITHPGVVDVYEVTGTAGGRVCLIMELLSGTTLLDSLHQHGGMRQAEAVPLMIQLADTFAAAHEQKIIHRDIKPENIFLVSDGMGGRRVKVLDFGIAKLLEGPGAAMTATNSMMGTAPYMSPEQFRSSKYVDHRSDIYALGCVFFEMLSGKPPFSGKTLAEHMHSHNFKPPPSLRSLVADATEPLEQLIGSMLKKDPAERPQSMREIATRLQAIASGKPNAAGPSGRATKPSSAGGPATDIVDPAARNSSNATVFAIIAAVVVIAACAAAVALL